MADLDKQLQKAREAYDLRQKGVGLTKEQNKLADEYVKMQELINDSEEARLERLENAVNKLKEQKDTLKELAALGVEVSGQYEKDLELRIKQNELAEEELLKKRKSGEITQQELADEYKKLAATEKRLKIESQGASDAEGLLKRMTGITKTPTTVLGKIAQDPAGYMKGTMGRMKGLVSSASIMTSTIDKVVEATVAMALEQDKAVVQFNRATGASGQFDAQIQDTNFNLRFAGVSAAEAGQSFQDLFTVVSDFTLMTKEEQMVLGETTAILNELGIASQDTAANIQLATKGLGMSVEQAEYLVRDLKTFAQDLGLSTGQVAKDFSRMAPMITEIGTKGVQAFKNLQKVVKTTYAFNIFDRT